MTTATLPLYTSRSAASKTAERREQPRIRTNDAAAMRLLRPFVPGQIQVRILDVSKDGLRLGIPMPVEPGALVHVRLGDSSIIAEVRHCSSGPDGFQAGLWVDSVTRLIS